MVIPFCDNLGTASGQEFFRIMLTTGIDMVEVWRIRGGA